MIFDYALYIMVLTLAINWRGDGFIIAGIFLLVSVLFELVIDSAVYVESYIFYAFGELILIHFISICNGPDKLVTDMIKLSILSIVVQLSGLLMWIEYYSSAVYMVLCQAVFILQIIRLIAHGLATRKAFYIRGGLMDSIHSSNSGKKL